MKDKNDVKKRKKARESRPFRSVNLVQLCALLFACWPFLPLKLPPVDTNVAILVDAVAVVVIGIVIGIEWKGRLAVLQLFGGGVSFGILRRLFLSSLV